MENKLEISNYNNAKSTAYECNYTNICMHVYNYVSVKLL